MTPAERAAAYKLVGRLLLPIGEGDSRKTYIMPDPDGILRVAYEDIYQKVYRLNNDGVDPESPIALTRSDAQRILSLADGYLILTTYTLGQEHCVEKLREIWRARRAEEP